MRKWQGTLNANKTRQGVCHHLVTSMPLDCKNHEGRGLFCSLVLAWVPEIGVLGIHYTANEYLGNNKALSEEQKKKNENKLNAQL